MAFLSRHRKVDLVTLAYEIGIDIGPNDRIADICAKIKDDQNYDEEFCFNCIDNIKAERESTEAIERENAERERERAEREFELERLRLANAGETISNSSSRAEHVRPNRKIRDLIPKFDSESSEISLYFTLFERQARAAEIDETQWVSELLSLLPLDLVQMVIKEPEERSNEYRHVKHMLLDRFKMKPEAFRIKFTQHQKKQNALWKELVFELRNYLEGWLEGVEVKDFEGLKNLMITDQIKRRVPHEIKDHFVDEWAKLTDPSLLAGKIDEYESVRGNRKSSQKIEKRGMEKTRPGSPKNERKNSTPEKSKPGNSFWKSSAPKGNWRNEHFEARRPLACYVCHSTEHLRPNCPQLKREEKINKIGDRGADEDLFAPYMSTALVNHKKMSILRDSGASIDLVSSNHLTPGSLTGETIWVRQPLDENFCALPLAKIELESPEFGKICTKAAVVDARLDAGYYLLGNRTQKLIEESKTSPNLNAVVTRRRAKAERKVNEEEGSGSQESAPAIVDKNEEEDLPFPLPQSVMEESALVQISPESFASEQKDCPLLKPIWVKAREKKGEYEIHQNLLFRINTDHRGNTSRQLLIPEKFRGRILSLCHEDTSSHLGVTKTKDRVLKHYFWPNCIGDIEEFVRSCHPCQLVGKPKEKKKAPLKIVPVITEIFSKINIDVVGPLPASSKGNRYLLTAICLSSKYPDAVPMKDVLSTSIIDGLLWIFSRYGYPRELQSDLGKSFTSNLTSEFLERFGVRVTHSSVCHPQSNPVERFHRTLKRLLKVLCLESGNEWERILPSALLAIRTVTHESTGFTPAELVHGRNLRTPSELLYDHWVDTQTPESLVTEYVFDLINRMKRCQDLAIERMIEVQGKRKSWYDKNTVKRKFNIGDQVLVLATSKPNKLSVQWVGPGVVESQISDTNYVVRMSEKKDKTQIYHVNLLKPYHQRPEHINLILSDHMEISESETEIEIPYPNSNPNIYDFEEIIRDSELSERLNLSQIEQLKAILSSHSIVFSNDPGKTHLVEHDIELISNQPIRSKPYRTSHRQTEILKIEIKRMLDLNIIEIGQSDYTSPMILVEAPGKDPRPCIDYRRLNSIIRTEYFPLPNIEERVEKVSAAKFITVIDLAKGYWQIPLSKRAQRYAAFVTSFGTYVPLRLPFGLLNAPYFFSKLMAQILEGCEEFAVPYLDDVAIFSDSWEDHLKHLGVVLQRIEGAKLTIKPSKCRFAQNCTKYLGHIVGGGMRSPAEAKIKAVVDFPTPTNKTQIRAFLGLAGYYAHYVHNFSVIAAPLTNALKGRNKRESVTWNEECDKAFKELKIKLTNKPVLYAPDYNKEFIIQTDASDHGIGIVMSQMNEKNEEHPIIYLSKKFSDVEKKYCVTERECASIIYAITKLKYYLDGQSFIIETDHNPLVWLNKNRGRNPRLMRWSLALQPYKYTVRHKAGKKHQNADSLSRSGS